MSLPDFQTLQTTPAVSRTTFFTQLLAIPALPAAPDFTADELPGDALLLPAEALAGTPPPPALPGFPG
jgi:hypothetical protein